MSRILAGVVAVAALGVSGCGLMGDPWSGETAQTRVIVTIPALESFVRAVGKDKVAVRCLCTKTGPHDYNADMADLGAFARAHLFLAVGLSLDDKFATDLFVKSRRKKEALKFVKVGHLLPPSRIRELEDEHGHGHDHKGHEGHGHDHGKHDPHVWLGLPEAVILVDKIRELLGEVDPDNAEAYDKNAKAYTEELRKVEAEAKKEFNGKKGSLITFHDSFGYFARAFEDNLQIAAVMEPTPGDSPDPAFLAKIVKVVQAYDKPDKKDKTYDKAIKYGPVRAITAEPQYAEGSVKKVVEELKAKKLEVKIVKVDPLETGEPEALKKDGGKWYLDRMRKNIKAIADALK